MTTPTTAAQRKTRPTCDAMNGHRMNSPEERPTPAATMPGPMMLQVLLGRSGRSRTVAFAHAPVATLDDSRIAVRLKRHRL